jgi:hypothetical protein
MVASAVQGMQYRRRRRPAVSEDTLKSASVPAAFIVALVLVGSLTQFPLGHAAQPPTDPFEGHVFAGAAYDDNLFRLEGDAEGLETIGTTDLEDWYRYAGAGFRASFPGDDRRFDVDAEIFRQTYDEFDDLDHTGGRLNANGEWELSTDTRGLLGYGYDRRLQSFTNKNAATRDIQQRHGVTGALERTLAERWQLRLGGGWSDLNFSSSDFLDKQQLDAETEIRYAASQNSIFGLLASYTESNFDSNDARDFSGWSAGPVFEWQITSSLQISANVGYTHRALDDPGDLEDYDGVTGYVATRWAPGDTFSSEIRVFRDVTNLGGEVSEYTERTGLRWRPVWRMTPKLSTRVVLGFEQRDFTALEGGEDREDDYLLADVWLDFAPTQRLLMSVGYAFETRDSNEDDQEFDAHVFRGEVRFSF